MPRRKPDFFDLMDAWEGIGVVVHRDAPTGTWIFIALHDDALGTPVGGCRMMVYPRPEDGLRDAMRLAEGMTYKWGAIELPFGGGKSVLAVPRPLEGEERRGLFRRFGALLNSLGGAYGTGEDLGTTPADMREIASVSEHVVCLHRGDDKAVDPGPFTAVGVLAGIKAALRHRFGSEKLKERTVLIQGVGDVGEPLARLISGEGGSVVLSDIDQDKAFSLAVELGGSTVTPEEVYDARCHVYAPCAVGGTLNRRTIPKLRCDIVAGSANNQLERREDAELLKERWILYAPDYVINAGGAMAFGLMHQGERDIDVLFDRVRGIGDTLAAVFERSAAEEVSPLEAADARVREVLERAGGTRTP
ncbi:MAG: Glu/Leu/Phe/Val dehydrogenase dimerization domain-containing protein [Gemmatimonadota bacterium]